MCTGDSDDIGSWKIIAISRPRTERMRFEFRTEVFNIANHFNPDPGTLDRNVRSATFGMIGGGVQGITTRVIQLGGKLYF